MRAAFIRRYGKQENLEIGNLPEPVVGDHDVLIEIRAAGINPVDYRVRDGALKAIRKFPFPLILGHDLAGVVVGVGSKVSRFKPGDEVFARPKKNGIGTLAERIAVDEEEVALKPRNLDFAEAASLPLVGLTSWQALVDIGKLRPGQKVLIHAGSGGVGSFAIQLAKHLGAVVTTTASSRNIDLVKGLGADIVVDYTKQDFTQVAKGQDFVFATMGGDTLYRSFEVVAPGGIVVSLTDAPDAVTARELGLGPLMQAVFGMLSWRARRLAARHQAAYRFIFMRASGAQLAQIAGLVEEGKIRPVVEKVYPFSEAQSALKHCESGRTTGKIVVAVR